jgi:hypothetical protein
MNTVLCIHRYEEGSEMHMSDQITVHSRLWEDLHRDYYGGARPLFVEIAEMGSGDSIIGRIRPSAGAISVSLDTCTLPDWMWLRLGAPEEMWISLRPTDIPDAGSIRLKPRDSRLLATLDNPLEALTAALSGSSGQSWACLNQGVELPLLFGDFDVVEIKSIEGFPVSAACILNLDVDLELEEPVQRPPTPVIPSFDPPPGVMWFTGMEKVVGLKK